MASVSIRKVDETWASVEFDDPIAELEAWERFSYQAPGAEWDPRVRSGHWDGMIRLYRKRARVIYTGLVPDVYVYCVERGYRVDIDPALVVRNDREAVGTGLDGMIERIGLKHEPRDYQREAVVRALETERRLILSPTSSGKSLIIYLLLRYVAEELGVERTLTIVPKTGLVTQMHGDFLEYSGGDIDASMIFAGRDRTNLGTHVVSTWQSITDMEPEWYGQFGAVVGDEVHHFKANVLSTVMERLVNARYRIGTTGTLSDAKVHELVLRGLFGPVFSAVSIGELMDRGLAARATVECIVLGYPDEFRSRYSAASTRPTMNDYRREVEFVETHAPRQRFLSRLVDDLPGNVLVAFEHVDHGERIAAELSGLGKPVEIIHGDVHIRRKDEIRSSISAGGNTRLVASFGTTSEGVNIPAINDGVFASPIGKSRIRILQTIGRMLRASVKKTTKIFDIVDDLSYNGRSNLLLKHYHARRRLYQETGLKFNEYRVELR